MSSISRRALLASSALAAGGITTQAAWAGANRKPRQLRHMLSNETYSLRDEIAAGTLSLLTAGEFYNKELGIRGVSLNDIYFKSWEKGYLDQIAESFKAND